MLTNTDAVLEVEATRRLRYAKKTKRKVGTQNSTSGEEQVFHKLSGNLYQGFNFKGETQFTIGNIREREGKMEEGQDSHQYKDFTMHKKGNTVVGNAYHPNFVKDFFGSKGQ